MRFNGKCILVADCKIDLTRLLLEIGISDPVIFTEAINEGTAVMEAFFMFVSSKVYSVHGRSVDGFPPEYFEPRPK